jgi:hypothetical protein
MIEAKTYHFFSPQTHHVSPATAHNLTSEKFVVKRWQISGSAP